MSMVRRSLEPTATIDSRRGGTRNAGRFALHSTQHQEQRMATYGKKAGDKVEKAMHEKKRGTLKSGGSGKKVTSRKQAIAIGLSEARRAGKKVPKKRSS